MGGGKERHYQEKSFVYFRDLMSGKFKGVTSCLLKFSIRRISTLE